jgi:hypothetical protein
VDRDELPDSASSLQSDEPINMGQGSSASNEETAATETSEDAGSNQQLPSRFSPVNSLGPSIGLRTFSHPEFMHLYLCHK